jgi:hypothetical protein
MKQAWRAEKEDLDGGWRYMRWRKGGIGGMDRAWFIMVWREGVREGGKDGCWLMTAAMELGGRLHGGSTEGDGRDGGWNM